MDIPKFTPEEQVILNSIHLFKQQQEQEQGQEQKQKNIELAIQRISEAGDEMKVTDFSQWIYDNIYTEIDSGEQKLALVANFIAYLSRNDKIFSYSIQDIGYVFTPTKNNLQN